MSKNIILEVQDLTVQDRGPKILLNSVTFQIRGGGRYLHLWGRVGSGKSLTSLAIMRSSPKQSKSELEMWFEGEIPLLPPRGMRMQKVRAKL